MITTFSRIVSLPLLVGPSLLFFGGLFFGGSVFFPADAVANTPAIYVVNLNKVLQESVVGKAARNDLEQEAKLAQAKLKREKDELETTRAKIAKQASLLSPDALEAKAESFREKERELSRKLKDEKERLDRESSKKIARIVKDIDVLIESLAKEKDYSIVLEYDPRVVVYVDDKFDLTSEVVSQLDKKRTSL